MNLYDWRGNWDRGNERLGSFVFGVTWRERRLGLEDAYQREKRVCWVGGGVLLHMSIQFDLLFFTGLG